MGKIEIGAIQVKGKSDKEETRKKVADAETRKADANETLDEAWERIEQTKSYEKDKEKLDEVRRAMNRGVIGREPVEEGKKQKKFSAAEAIRLWKELEDRKKVERTRILVESTPDNYQLVNNSMALEGLRKDVKEADLIAIDCETFGEKPGDQFDPWIGEMAGFSVTVEDRHYYVPLNHTAGNQLDAGTVWEALKIPMETTLNILHNAPFDAKFFMVKYGVDLIKNLYNDTQVMGWGADENISHRLKDLAEKWLGLKESWTYDKLFSKRHRFNEVPLDAALVYAAGDTEKTMKLYHFMKKQFEKSESGRRIARLIEDIEIPVEKTFIYSDLKGIKFSAKESKELDAVFAKEEAELKADIDAIFGEEINLNSPAQLSKKLFQDLKLPDIADGSTKEKVLKKLSGKHRVVPKLLEIRAVGKLRQSFTEKLPEVVHSDGLIHPSFSTWGAATGRFTCKEPNLQQIPSKRPEVRKLFKAMSEDRILISMDFSQIELRVLAHLAQEQTLIHAFKNGRDIHSTTAAMISNGKYSYEDIEKDKDTEGHPCQKLRKQAKTVNFGIVYGMSAKGLSDTLEITKKEAQGIIDNYFAGYPGISTYMDEQKRLARKYGFVTDMFGRKRRLRSHYRTGNDYDGFSADRMAGNFPVQASAGSILKKAIVDLMEIIPEMDVNISLQVHDELVFDAPKDIAKEDVERIRKTMEQAVELVVPVKSDVEISPEYWMQNLTMDEWFKN